MCTCDISKYEWSISIFEHFMTKFHELPKQPSYQFQIIAYLFTFYSDMSRSMTKPTKWSLRPAKTKISLGIRPVWSESSLCAQWVSKDPSFLHVDSEDWSDWAGAQADPSLGWAHRLFLLVLSCSSSDLRLKKRTVYKYLWELWHTASQRAVKDVYWLIIN